MTWRRAARKAAAMLFPWPSRHERQAAIRAACAEKEHSRASAGRAHDIERQIRHMTSEDYFAAVIAAQIMRGSR